MSMIDASFIIALPVASFYIVVFIELAKELIWYGKAS